MVIGATTAAMPGVHRSECTHDDAGDQSVWPVGPTPTSACATRRPSKTNQVIAQPPPSLTRPEAGGRSQRNGSRSAPVPQTPPRRHGSSASAPNEPKPTSTPHEPNASASPNNSTRLPPTLASSPNQPTIRHHAPARRAVPRSHEARAREHTKRLPRVPAACPIRR